ncbi:MAG: major outer membrane protein [Arcobacteraceae bacterium]
MTKMIKMSLIAAVAVTGMTSAVNAQNLEDAIKGVDVSGYIDYRLENKSISGSDTIDFNENE